MIRAMRFFLATMVESMRATIDWFFFATRDNSLLI
jgi:hypothetical protein